jgi:hypothetical protein
MVQLNVGRRAHDSGAQAEPANRGSTGIDPSPGMTVGAGRGRRSYVQLPLYQRMTGIQLVPRGSRVVGWTSNF